MIFTNIGLYYVLDLKLRVNIVLKKQGHHELSPQSRSQTYQDTMKI